MKRSIRLRKTAHLSHSISQHLNMYGLAAGAAGVSVLALAQPSEAKIVYTAADVRIAVGQVVPIDVNHDGVNDFYFKNSWVSGGSNLSYLDVWALANSNSVVVQFSGGKNLGPADLKAGVNVGPTGHFSFGGLMAGYCRMGIYCKGFVGPWAHGGKGVKNRYLGLRFVIKSKVHFGWARLTVDPWVPLKGHKIVGHLTGYAYETIPNKPIITGKTKGPDDNSLEASNVSLTTPPSKPATLGMLAMGSPALSIWRREEPIGSSAESN